jgi:hypothetical protein
MGSFFTNVQVFAGQRPVADVRAAIIAAIRQQAIAAGLEEDETIVDDEDAERVVTIGPAGSGSWIAVYDERTEDQDAESLRELGEALSQVGAAAVTVLVHDSDILQMQLYQQGAQVDAYHSYPNDYRDDPDEPRAIRLIWKPDSASQYERREITLAAGQSAEGVPLRYVVVEDLPIPAGQTSWTFKVTIREG